MKIAFVAQPLDDVRPPHQNSVGIWVYQAARRLAQSCDVSVYLKGGRLRKRVEFAEGVHFRYIPMGPDGWLLRFLQLTSDLRDRRSPLFASKLYYLGFILLVALDLRRRQCDIVQLFNFSQFVPFIRRLNSNTKIVLRMSCEWLTQLDREMIERRLQDVDLLIGCSDFITDKIRCTYPRFAGRCETVHNARDTEVLVPGSRKQEAKTGKRLLFVGRVSPEKGVHVLLDAFRSVVEHYPEAELRIVGSKGQLPFDFLVALSDDERISRLSSFYSGESRYYYSAELERRVRSLGLDKQVTFVGPVPFPQLLEYYQSADVFVFPSVWDEPSGNPPIEAMAVGVPVVSTTTGGTAEYVEQGKTGLLVEPGDPASLANAILRLLENDDLRKAMGSAARQRAVQRFSWDRLVQNLQKNYKAILHRDGRSKTTT